MNKRPELIELAHFYQNELLELYRFLDENKPIWSQEVLNTFPHSLEAYSPSWLESFEALTMEEEWRHDSGEEVAKIKMSPVGPLLEKTRLLGQVKRWPEATPQEYPSWALFKVGGKKQHEIHNIVSLLPTLGLNPGDNIVDIGGGKGHLPRVLALYHGLHCTTLDQNHYFQELGRERLKKYPHPEGAGKVHFVHHSFGSEENQEKEKEEQYFNQGNASLGLHTCGPLAIHHIDHQIRMDSSNKAFLNFGCCYQKLDPEKDILLSDFAKNKVPLKFTKYALTLASRGHTVISYKDYLLKKRVKFYRGALHLLLNKLLNKDFHTVGSAHPRDYNKSFSHYALLKCKEHGVSVREEELEKFYHDPEIQHQLHRIYRANLLRWRFGRVLEKFLVMNRALYLVENQQAAEVYQFFDESLSPRNLGLMIRR